MIDKSIYRNLSMVRADYAPGNPYCLKVLMAALSQIDARKVLDTTHKFRVTAQDMADQIGRSNSDNYLVLRKAADDLFNMHITVYHDPHGVELPITKRKINLVDSCNYIDGEGCIDIQFTVSIAPYLRTFPRRYLRTELCHVQPMKSAYGMVLYDWLSQWPAKKSVMEVQVFRQRFGLTKKYKKMGSLKEKVITPALEDINKYTDLIVEFKQEKRGREITHFVFNITSKENAVENSIENLYDLLNSHVIGDEFMSPLEEFNDDELLVLDGDELIITPLPNDKQMDVIAGVDSSQRDFFIYQKELVVLVLKGSDCPVAKRDEFINYAIDNRLDQYPGLHTGDYKHSNKIRDAYDATTKTSEVPIESNEPVIEKATPEPIYKSSERKLSAVQIAALEARADNPGTFDAKIPNPMPGTTAEVLAREKDND